MDHIVQPRYVVGTNHSISHVPAIAKVVKAAWYQITSQPLLFSEFHAFATNSASSLRGPKRLSMSMLDLKFCQFNVFATASFAFLHKTIFVTHTRYPISYLLLQ